MTRINRAGSIARCLKMLKRMRPPIKGLSYEIHLPVETTGVWVITQRRWNKTSVTHSGGGDLLVLLVQK